MYRRRSQCCPGYFESGDLCVREYPLFNSFVLSDGIQVMSAGIFFSEKDRSSPRVACRRRPCLRRSPLWSDPRKHPITRRDHHSRSHATTIHVNLLSFH